MALHYREVTATLSDVDDATAAFLVDEDHDLSILTSVDWDGSIEYQVSYDEGATWRTVGSAFTGDLEDTAHINSVQHVRLVCTIHAAGTASVLMRIGGGRRR